MCKVLDYNAERLARVRDAARGCTLEDSARQCERYDCTGCGFQKGEQERRKKLPMHRNHKGLWESASGSGRRGNEA